jgi:nucleotide-binding universal stress UspA family protein
VGVDEAKLRDAPVRAVDACPHALAERLAPDPCAAAVPDRHEHRSQAPRRRDPAVERVTIEGPTAECLAEVAHGAELSAVGSRHHHSLGSLVIGSVSAECVLRADCPVVVVHPLNRSPS